MQLKGVLAALKTNVLHSTEQAAFDVAQFFIGIMIRVRFLRKFRRRAGGDLPFRDTNRIRWSLTTLAFQLHQPLREKAATTVASCLDSVCQRSAI